MFKLKITEEQKKYAWSEVKGIKFNRGEFDGNQKELYGGFLAEVIFSDMFGLKRKKIGEGSDGGVDFKTGTYTIDLKTMLRTVNMKNDYVHNLLDFQVKRFNPDFYVFASINTKTDEITFCGYLKKTELKDSYFIKKGTERPRNNGTKLTVGADMYEIPQGDLKELNNKEEITALT